jgi:pimeloyl-ACP methyl ester carboxylesterase
VPPDSDAADQQAGAQADVFFVHPTTYVTFPVRNARYNEPGAAKARLEFQVLSFDAAAFNECCRIFVPRYRQASIASFLHPGPRSLAAFDLAYADVVRAFDYYLSHHNSGRPFIIAGHSQGSLHAMRLLLDRITGTPLQGQLVAAYLVGWAIPEDIEQAGLPVCRSALQNRCVIGWNSVTPAQTLDFMRGRAVFWLDGRYQLLADRDIVCVNPLTWTKDGDAPAMANLGSLPQSKPGEPLEPVIPQLTGAACEDGVLHVFLTPGMRLEVGYRARFGSFHTVDYNLFYMNVRRNAADRVGAFLAKPR